MQTLFSNDFRTSQRISLSHLPASRLVMGSLAELVFSEDQSAMMQLMLLPLLQQLSTESRWQLWLTPPQKLSRDWLKSVGLPLDKVMQVQQSGELSPLDAMNRALRTGNYSVVIGWAQAPLTTVQRNMLEASARTGQGSGLILRSSLPHIAAGGPLTSQKIPTSLYH